MVRPEGPDPPDHLNPRGKGYLAYWISSRAPSTRLSHLSRSLVLGTTYPLNRIGGESGIRTHGAPAGAHGISSAARSATPASLRAIPGFSFKPPPVSLCLVTPNLEFSSVQYPLPLKDCKNDYKTLTNSKETCFQSNSIPPCKTKPFMSVAYYYA